MHFLFFGKCQLKTALVPGVGHFIFYCAGANLIDLDNRQE